MSTQRGELATILLQIDSDGSGAIDYTEFLAAMIDRKQYLREDICWSAFKVFDRDGSGTIGHSEVVNVLGDGNVKSVLGKEIIDNIFGAIDADGDGKRLARIRYFNGCPSKGGWVGGR